MLVFILKISIHIFNLTNLTVLSKGNKIEKQTTNDTWVINMCWLIK